MLEEEAKFDTFCCNPQCINNQRAFFKYAPDNLHEAQDHTIRILHPVFFNRFCQNGRPSEHSAQRRHAFNRQVEDMLQEEGRRIGNYVRDKYLSPYLQDLNDKVATETTLDAGLICNRLKQGDHDLLKSILEYEQTFKNDQDEERVPFLDYYNYRDNKVRELQKDLEGLTLKVRDILDIAFENVRELIDIKATYEQTSVQENKQLPVNPPPPKPKPVSHKAKAVQEKRAKPEECQSYEETFTHEKSKKIKKKKPHVKKEHSDSRRIEEDWDSTSEEEKETVDRSEEIRVVSESEIQVLHCQQPRETFRYISRTFKQLTTLHIFHHRFASDKVLRRLLKHYPYLQSLTLNCNHKFSWDMLDDLTPYQLGNMRKVELKWALDLFFKEYHLANEFPTKPWDSRERNSKTNMPLQKFSQMPNNDTLWIESDEHAQDLLLSKRPLGDIRVVHFNPAAFQKLGHIKELKKFEGLTSLTTLILKGINLSSQEDFGKVIGRNPGLTAIMICQCTNLKKQTDSVFDSLAQLEHLESFSLTPRNETLFVKPDKLMRLTQLKHLYLNKVNFEDENCRYKDSSNLRSIASLRNLRHLSLYACNPIFSDLFSYIDEDCLAQMEFLSLGYTEVDNSCLEHLRKMRNLQYLNIDGVSISGQTFAQLCEQQLALHGQPWPLRALSMEEMSATQKESLGKVSNERFGLPDLEVMAKTLPLLNYIGIRNCHNLRTFDFGRMPALKTIALNRELKGMMAYLPASIEIYQDNDDC